MKATLVGAALMAAMMVVPALAQDADTKKQRRQQGGQQNVAAQTMKQLEKVKLTEEQTAKIKELGKTAAAKMKSIRDEAGITPQLTKKRMEAQKSLKDSGKKGKELADAINQAAGFTEAQIAATEQLTKVRTEFQKQVVAMLTDEQKENLPPALKRASGQGRQANAKPRKKKEAN